MDPHCPPSSSPAALPSVRLLLVCLVCTVAPFRSIRNDSSGTNASLPRLCCLSVSLSLLMCCLVSAVPVDAALPFALRPSALPGCAATHTRKALTGQAGLASPHNHQLRLLRRDPTAIQESTEGNNGTQEDGIEQCFEDRTQQGDEERRSRAVGLRVYCGQSWAAPSGRRDRVSSHTRHGFVQRIRPVQASRKPVTLAATSLSVQAYNAARKQSL